MVGFEDADWADLQQRAKTEGITVSAYVRRAVTWFMRQYPDPFGMKAAQEAPERPEAPEAPTDENPENTRCRPQG